MITDFTLPRQKQMHVYGLFEKRPGSRWRRHSRSRSSGMGRQRLNWLQLGRPWRECVGGSLTQWKFFWGSLTMPCCYEGFKIMCRLDFRDIWRRWVREVFLSSRQGLWLAWIRGGIGEKAEVGNSRSIDKIPGLGDCEGLHLWNKIHVEFFSQH